MTPKRKQYTFTLGLLDDRIAGCERDGWPGDAVRIAARKVRNPLWTLANNDAPYPAGLVEELTATIEVLEAAIVAATPLTEGENT